MTDELQQQTTYLQACIDRLKAGDESASAELLTSARGRLERLARKMFSSEPRIGRWEEVEDVFQSAALRLHRSLGDVKPATVRDFFRLAAVQIRRELIDLARHHYGPDGDAANHASQADQLQSSGRPSPAMDPGDQTLEPSRLSMWTEFHRQVEMLPSDEREVFELLWYQGLTQAESAAILRISERTLHRRWRAGCEQLRARLKGEPPPT